jgi:hypothetical protein
MKIRRAALLFYFLPFLIAVPARAVNHYYVTTNGSDSNPCSQSSPCLTVQHAVEVFVLASDGAVIHVAAGTYTDSVNDTTLSPACTEGNVWFCANRGGTSAAPLTIQCDASNWPTWPSSGGCVANPGGNGSAIPWVEFDNGQYVTVKGFEYGNHPGAGFGEVGFSNNITITQNYLHDVGQTASSGCPASGMIYNSYTSTGWIVTQNKVIHFGDDTLTSCNFANGIYANGNIVVQNNIIARAAATGINSGNGDCEQTITNNVIFDNRLAGIYFQSGGTPCTPFGYDTITNNIIVNNSNSTHQDGGINSSSTSGASTQYAANNIMYNNNGGNFIGFTGTQSGNITTEAPTTTFVNFQDNGTGDYHLKPGSVAINGGTNNGAGSPGCASACTPTVDFARNPRPTPPNTNVDIGAYELGSGVVSGGPAPPTAVIVVNVQ